MSENAGESGHTSRFAIDVRSDLPDLRSLAGVSERQPEELTTAVYFDTPDLRLWARGITLSRRPGPALQWTLTLPGPASEQATGSDALHWAGDEQMPAGVMRVVAGVVRRAGLAPVAELRTERIRFVLRDNGVPWAELANDVVTIVGGRADAERFRRLELHVDGTVPAGDRRVGALVKALRRAGARPQARPDLAEVVGPRPAPPAPVATSSAEEMVVFALSDTLGRLLDADVRIRSAVADIDAEDIHRARVATRRLRADLKTLRSILDPVWVDHVRADLRWLGAALGEVRDADVLAARLHDAGASPTVVRVIGRERSGAVERLLTALGERRYLDLLDRLHAASLLPPVADRHRARRAARKVLPPLADQCWKKVRSDVRHVSKRPADTQLHRVRKRSKQLRYASELAVPVVGGPARRTAKAAASLQTVLGSLNDAVVVTEWLERAGRDQGELAPGEVATLIRAEQERRRQLRRHWRSSYRRLARSHSRAWL